MSVSRSRYYKYLSNNEIISTVQWGKALRSHCVVPAKWAYSRVMVYIDQDGKKESFETITKKSGSHTYIRMAQVYIGLKVRIKLLIDEKKQDPLIPEIVTDHFSEIDG